MSGVVFHHLVEQMTRISAHRLSEIPDFGPRFLLPLRKRFLEIREMMQRNAILCWCSELLKYFEDGIDLAIPREQRLPATCDERITKRAFFMFFVKFASNPRSREKKSLISLSRENAN